MRAALLFAPLLLLAAANKDAAAWQHKIIKAP